MQYVNFVFEGGEEPTLYTAPVSDSDATYLRRAVSYLKSLSDEDYLNGPAAILQTMAKYSYILDGNDLYWCVEWEPGLIVVKMAADTEMKWVALRSPVPDFGGREPLPEDGDPEDYVHDNNPQYNLIFVPWDAQFDPEEREWGSFALADVEVQTRFQNALAHANALGSGIEERLTNEGDSWIKRCKQNLEASCGDGIRLDAAG
jgi:hypothetical protein